MGSFKVITLEVVISPTYYLASLDSQSWKPKQTCLNNEHRLFWLADSVQLLTKLKQHKLLYDIYLQQKLNSLGLLINNWPGFCCKSIVRLRRRPDQNQPTRAGYWRDRTAGWLGWNKGTFVSPSWPSGCQPLGEVVGNLKASFIWYYVNHFLKLHYNIIKWKDTLSKHEVWPWSNLQRIE